MQGGVPTLEGGIRGYASPKICRIPLRGGRTMRTLSLLIVVIVLTFVAVTWAADRVMVEPKDVKWEDISALPPGAKVAVIEGPLDQATPFILRCKFHADFQIPAHWPPAIEHVTVLSGTLNMGPGDKPEPAKTHALRPAVCPSYRRRSTILAGRKKTRLCRYTDKDLLSLQHYEGITVITPEAFMATLRERGRLNS